MPHDADSNPKIRNAGFAMLGVLVAFLAISLACAANVNVIFSLHGSAYITLFLTLFVISVAAGKILSVLYFKWQCPTSRFRPLHMDDSNELKRLLQESKQKCNADLMIVFLLFAIDIILISLLSILHDGFLLFITTFLLCVSSFFFVVTAPFSKRAFFSEEFKQLSNLDHVTATRKLSSFQMSSSLSIDACRQKLTSSYRAQLWSWKATFPKHSDYIIATIKNFQIGLFGYRASLWHIFLTSTQDGTCLECKHVPLSGSPSVMGVFLIVIALIASRIIGDAMNGITSIAFIISAVILIAMYIYIMVNMFVASKSFLTSYLFEILDV
jgi:hypothetical protein